MTESQALTTEQIVVDLKAACEAEMVAARALKGHPDPLPPDLAKEWSRAYGDRVKATHPAKMLQLIESWEIGWSE